MDTILKKIDPRYYQISVLSFLVLYGLFVLHFEVSFLQVLFTLSFALGTQYLCSRYLASIPFEYKSALISALSLCLILRSNFLLWISLGAILSIASKFILRLNNKHIFNPTNFGIVALLGTGQIWVSAGQWGNFAFFAFLMACLGFLVVFRSSRSDVTIAFLFFYLSFIFARSYSLGEPMTIPIHRIQSGALLLFSFFMISDPKSTPDSRLGRIVFALLVAIGAYWIQFKWFKTNGLLWSLAFFSLWTPLIDKLLSAPQFEWNKTTSVEGI